MSTYEILLALGQKIDTGAGELNRLSQYFEGKQPTAFIAPKAREALGDRLRMLTVNVPALAIEALAERLRLLGFRIDGAESPDADLWRIWRRNRMHEMSSCAHVDAFEFGRSYGIVWAGSDRATPRVTIESAYQVATAADPESRTTTAAVKRWASDDGFGRGVVFEPDKITKYRTEGRVTAGVGIPTTGWRVVETLNNPLGVVPVVPILNRGRLLDFEGRSEMTPLIPLADGLNKILTDMMVTSEQFARPRRWSTGIELIERKDANGNPIEGEYVDPFATDSGRTWQAEQPDARFGQFPQADLAAYEKAAGMLLQYQAALAALPPHFVGIHADANPTSADALRASEANLVNRAFARMRTFETAWAEIIRLVIAVRDGRDTRDLDVECLWSSPETSSPGMEADAVTKLYAAKLLSARAALERLDYGPTEIDRILGEIAIDSLTNQGVDLSVAA